MVIPTPRLGSSARATYLVLRGYLAELHSTNKNSKPWLPAYQALAIAKMQENNLGAFYPGGLECVPYRHMWKCLEIPSDLNNVPVVHFYGGIPKQSSSPRVNIVPDSNGVYVGIDTISGIVLPLWGYDPHYKEAIFAPENFINPPFSTPYNKEIS